MRKYVTQGFSPDWLSDDSERTEYTDSSESDVKSDKEIYGWKNQKGWHPFLFQKLLEMTEESGLKNIENIKRARK